LKLLEYPAVVKTEMISEILTKRRELRKWFQRFWRGVGNSRKWFQRFWRGVGNSGNGFRDSDGVSGTLEMISEILTGCRGLRKWFQRFWRGVGNSGN